GDPAVGGFKEPARGRAYPYDARVGFDGSNVVDATPHRGRPDAAEAQVAQDRVVVRLRVEPGGEGGQREDAREAGNTAECHRGSPILEVYSIAGSTAAARVYRMSIECGSASERWLGQGRRCRRRRRRGRGRKLRVVRWNLKRSGRRFH